MGLKHLGLKCPKTNPYLVFEESTRGQTYDFENSEWYTKATVMGKPTFLQTVYFVKPGNIQTGRSEKEFQAQGTGNGLWLLLKNNTLLKAPMTKGQADNLVRK